MDFFFHQVILFLSIGGLFFLPGYLALRMLFGKREDITSWERILTAFAVSLGLLDFIMIFLGRIHIRLSPLSITAGLIISLAIFSFLRKISTTRQASTEETTPKQKFTLTRSQGILFLLIVAFTLLIKTIYLTDAAFPTATDLGHHLYWSKVITETGALPNYSKIEIVRSSDGEETLGTPSPIADFIIGEHLPIAALAMFSKNDFLSAAPIIFLLLTNILSVLIFFILALRLGEDIQHKFPSFLPERFGLIMLFLLGPLYAISSPQAKFVSGGVVGNTIGNLFIPLILLFFFRSIREKNSIFMGLAFFLTFTLAYTHHLSTLVLLFILIASILAITLLHASSITTLMNDWFRILRHPFPIVITIFCILFFFVVAMPTYIETHAVGTAIGTPTKTTRTGLSFSQLLSGTGEARTAIGIAGLFIIALFARAFKTSAGILIGWSAILLIMSLRPNLVFLNIPSDRIGNYAIFPIALLAGFTILLLPGCIGRTKKGSRTTLPLFVITSFVIILFAYASGSGSSDNGGSLLSAPKANEAVQTFAVSEFLADRISKNDIVLKDHNYLSADSFMKLFFMRDYGFPLSRGYFKRYETPGHEQCSLIMITSPNTPAGKQCFHETGTDIVIVDPVFDRAQFEKSPDFSRVYSSPVIQTYRKNL